jgi:hypothetical protein
MLLLMKFVRDFCFFYNGSNNLSFCLDERDINTDFLLVLLRDMLKVYPELKVILMSGMFKRF